MQSESFAESSIDGTSVRNWSRLFAGVCLENKSFHQIGRWGSECQLFRFNHTSMKVAANESSRQFCVDCIRKSAAEVEGAEFNAERKHERRFVSREHFKSTKRSKSADSTVLFASTPRNS